MKPKTPQAAKLERIETLLADHRKAADKARELLDRGLPMAWVRDLDEVGAPIREQAEEVDRYFRDAHQAYARAIDNAVGALEEVLLRISRDWTPAEIAAAKAFIAPED